MRAAELEGWVLQVVDAVGGGGRYESTRVELKREVPAAESRTARQIAGHANAAHGDEILWICGIDEKAHKVVGIGETPDPQGWWGGIASHFNGLAPRLLRHDVVPVRDSRVLALLIETERAPYVVRNPLYGGVEGHAIEFEVPWREGTNTRSARREDLLRLLIPSIRMPSVEVVGARLYEREESTLQDDRSLVGTGAYTWLSALTLFVVPRGYEGTTVFPGHRIRVQARSSAQESYELRWVGAPPSQKENRRELEVDRARTVELEATARSQKRTPEPSELLEVSWSLVPAGSETAIDIQLELRKAKPGEWSLEKARVDHVPAPPWRPAAAPSETEPGSGDPSS